MKRLDFNDDWQVTCLTREVPVKNVRLPHDAMLSEPRGDESRGEGNTGWYLGGDYSYKKIYRHIPGEAATRLLEFEGVYHNAEVFVNGRKAAFRPYGYTNFYVPLDDYLKEGDNEIEVIARNDDQPNSRWYSGTGIYRPVWLWTGKGAYIPVNGVRIHTVSIHPAVIQVSVETSCAGEVTLGVIDAGKEILTRTAQAVDNKVSLTLEIPDAVLWDVDCPKLYQLKVTFGGDTVVENFGIRTIGWDPQSGFTLNGKRCILRGGCIHHDNGLLGACAFPEAELRRVRALKAAGYNALRSAHNPCSKAILEACDREGMLMMDEYIDHWYIHKTAHDYVDYFNDWWKQDMKDMVEKDYNHPCVIMYSTGNEVSETAQEKGIRLTGEMTDWLHQLDGTRPVTCGINIFFNFLSSIGFGVYSDDKAQKSAQAADKAAKEAKKAAKAAEKKPKKKHVGSDFYNTLACVAGDNFMKLGATLPPCDWRTRDAFANMDIAGYNYGIFRYKGDLKKYPHRLILGSETFCKDAYKFWELAKANPRIIGDFVWSAMDYLGETGEGAAEYEDYKKTGVNYPMTGNNGRVDLLGKPRAEAAFTRVAFELDKGPFIAVTPVYQEEKLTLTGWALTKAVESWSWPGCQGKPARVEVYARAAAVELFVNGKSAGKKPLKNTCRVVFTVPYADGELTAVSYDASGRELGRKTLRTAEEETLLMVQPETEGVAAGELAFVNLRYTDSRGQWKPMEHHTLQVTVKNGTLMGLGSANSYVQGNYTDDTTETYYGEALAIVRALGDGPVQVSVTDECHTVTAELPLK